jgi:hypothetical protein
MKKIPMHISILMIITLLAAACTPAPGASAAEQTLEALYLEQTVEALTAQEEPAQAEEPAVVEEPTATREIVHSVLPGETGWVSQWWLDNNSSSTATQKRANGGDNLSVNLLERPFSAQGMDYRPDIDLIRVELSHNPTFYYFSLHLSGVNSATNSLSAHYGVEFDLSRDGRGDVLLWVAGDGNSEWNIADVWVFQDENNDVGGTRPVLADAPGGGGNGFEKTLFSPELLDDPDAAWKRVDPSDPTVIQLAIKRSLLGNAGAFFWRAWADDGVKDPGLFDYNDAFTLTQAGSPISGQNDYPLKDLALVDNTCRLAWGFEPKGDEPGICSIPLPTATPVPPTQTPVPPTLTPTETPFPIIT